MRHFPFVLGMTVLSFMFFILLFAAIGFGAGLSLMPLQIWLAAAASGGFAFAMVRFYYHEDCWRFFAGSIGAAIVLVYACMLLSGLFYDISYDGQVYHQEAVIQLAHHWNPFCRYLTKEQSPSAMLLNHYAKGPWIYEAALYAVTGQIEQSKAFNLLMLIASFLLAFAALRNRQRCGRREALFFSALLALNPVSVYQSLSFYIDGQLASLLLCLAALSYQMAGRYDGFVLAGFIMSIALLANVKFTGIVYAVACVGLLGGWLLLLKKKNACRDLGKASFLALVTGICLLGYNPYMTNSFFYGHPFYPLYGGGPNAMDIMTSNSPKGFSQMSRIEKWYAANFFGATNQIEREEPAVKWPFSLTAQELRPFVYGADIRIGGFGPWFSGMLIISGMLLPVLLKCGKQEALYGVGAVACMMLTALINPEFWWARYVPQIWLAVISLSFAARLQPQKSIRCLGNALAGAAVVNLLLVSCPYILGNYYCTQAVKQQLREMAASHNPVRVYFGEFTSSHVRFAEYPIAFTDTGADCADRNIEVLRYQYLTAPAKQAALAAIFTKERMDEHEE